MEEFLIIGGFIAMLAGLAGAVLPLPGPPLSYLGFWMLHYSKKYEFSTGILILFGVLTLLIVILDYLIPSIGAKKFGGSKYGAYGASAGLFIGIFFTPVGMFLGAFLGAFLAEYWFSKDQSVAFKAAIGSFLGIMTGIIAKVVLCLAMLGYVVQALWDNRA